MTKKEREDLAKEKAEAEAQAAIIDAETTAKAKAKAEAKAKEEKKPGRPKGHSVLVGQVLHKGVYYKKGDRIALPAEDANPLLEQGIIG